MSKPKAAKGNVATHWSPIDPDAHIVIKIIALAALLVGIAAGSKSLIASSKSGSPSSASTTVRTLHPSPQPVPMSGQYLDLGPDALIGMPPSWHISDFYTVATAAGADSTDPVTRDALKNAGRTGFDIVGYAYTTSEYDQKVDAIPPVLTVLRKRIPQELMQELQRGIVDGKLDRKSIQQLHHDVPVSVPKTHQVDQNSINTHKIVLPCGTAFQSNRRVAIHHSDGVVNEVVVSFVMFHGNYLYLSQFEMTPNEAIKFSGTPISIMKGWNWKT